VTLIREPASFIIINDYIIRWEAHLSTVVGEEDRSAVRRFDHQPIFFDNPPDKHRLRVSVLIGLISFLFCLPLAIREIPDTDILLMIVSGLVIADIAPYLAERRLQYKIRPCKIMVGNLGVTFFFVKGRPRFISWWEMGGFFISTNKGFRSGIRPSRGGAICFDTETGIVQQMAERYQDVVGVSPPISKVRFKSSWEGLSEKDLPV
jgi:hypothetical protein